MQKDGSRKNVVAKVSKDPNEDKNTYYRDVQAQACAKMWAMEYNDCGTPKVIDFVPAFVFELVDRPGRPLIGAEEFIEGVFQKHNNNVGGVVAGQEERATPNAFSHFTWEASNQSLLVCDIQVALVSPSIPCNHGYPTCGSYLSPTCPASKELKPGSVSNPCLYLPQSS